MQSLFSLCKTGNKGKAERENKQESKVLVEVDGRREGSTPVCCCGIIFAYLTLIEEFFSVMYVDFV